MLFLLPHELKFYKILRSDAIKFNLLVPKQGEFNIMAKEQHKRGQYTYNKKQLYRLLSAAESPRDRALLKLLMFAGLRREEVVSIERGHIDRSRKQARILGKGDKYRFVPLREDVIQDIDFHLAAMPRRHKKSPWLFPATNKKDSHLVAIQVNRILQRAAENVGIKNPNPKLKTVNPHSMRHTFARILKKKGVEITAIKEVMGHERIETTQEIYGLPSVKEIHKKVLNAIA
jgi:integrase/recombinase XerD